jgi:hypothetical protein
VPSQWFVYVGNDLTYLGKRLGILRRTGANHLQPQDTSGRVLDLGAAFTLCTRRQGCNGLDNVVSSLKLAIRIPVSRATHMSKLASTEFYSGWLAKLETCANGERSLKRMHLKSDSRQR